MPGDKANNTENPRLFTIGIGIKCRSVRATRPHVVYLGVTLAASSLLRLSWKIPRSETGLTGPVALPSSHSAASRDPRGEERSLETRRERETLDEAPREDEGGEPGG